MSYRWLVSSVAVTLISLSVAAFAAQKAAPNAPTEGAKAPQERGPEMIKELASTNPAVFAAALAEARAKLQVARSKGRELTQAPEGKWALAVLESQHFDLVEEFALATLKGVPIHKQDLSERQFSLRQRGIEDVLMARITAFQHLGKNEEALACSKSLYNVCRMQKTSEVIGIVSQCLLAVNKNDPDIVKRYKMEQVQGAQASSATEPALPPDKLIMAKIKVDASIYEASIALEKTVPTFTGQTVLGHLLLLADRPAEAKEVFERVKILADGPADLAAENVAKAIRAQDGTVGRANRYVLSLTQQPDPSAKKP